MSNHSPMDSGYSNVKTGSEVSTVEYVDRVVNPTALSPPTSIRPPALTKSDLAAAHVLEIKSSNGDGGHDPLKGEPEMAPWKPSFLRVAPLMGLAALAFTVLQMIASYAVLAASDGVDVSTWQYQPTVYLAILTAISNKSLAFSVVQGAVVTFWLRVLRGTTLAQLQRDWNYSQFVYKAICSGRNCSLLALACICATFVAIDGPLLQRATSVRNTVPESNVTLSVALSPELPSYFTGEVYDQNANVLDFSDSFLPVVREFISPAPIRGAITGCEGKCATTVRGPALAMKNCVSESKLVNFSRPLSDKEAQGLQKGETSELADDRRIFSVEFSINYGTPEVLEFKTVIVNQPSQESCAGPVTTTTCYLESAIAEYPIIVNDGILSFAEIQTPQSPKIIARANNTAMTNKTVNEYGLLQHDSGTLSTLAGVAMAANVQFYTSIYAVPGPSAQQPIRVAGPVTWFSFKHEEDYEGSQTSCLSAFSDPTQEVMGWLNELLFRTGVYTALNYDDHFFSTHLDDGLQVHYNVTGRLLSSINTFHTNFRYFALAATLQLFTVVVILTTFWGWWRLGRDASLSPLETAKAFDAPILRDIPSNKNGRAIAKIGGTRGVQYGILRHGPGFERLVVAAEGTVDEPMGQPLTARGLCATARAKMPRRRHWRGKPSAEIEIESRSQV